MPGNRPLQLHHCLIPFPGYGETRQYRESTFLPVLLVFAAPIEGQLSGGSGVSTRETGGRVHCPPDFRPGESRAKVPHFLIHNDVIAGYTSQSLGLRFMRVRQAVQLHQILPF